MLQIMNKTNVFGAVQNSASSSSRISNFTKRFAVLTLLLLTFVLGARAADYVISYTNGGTTYYLARNGTTGVQRVTTFDPTTCIWSCASNTAGTTAGTLNNSNTYGYLFQTVNGTRYFLSAEDDALALVTSASSNNNSFTRWRTNGTYVYNRYSNSRSYYIGLSNNGVARQTNQSNASRPYQVTFTPVSPTLTNPTINGNDVLTATGNYTYTASGATYQAGGYVNYSFNNANHFFDNNNTAITPEAATLNGTAWSISANEYVTINSSTGVVTVNKIPSSDITLTITATVTVSGGNPVAPAGTTLVGTKEITIQGSVPEAPTINVSGTTVTLQTDATGTTSIRYTIDGTNPTTTTGAVYSGAFDISGSTNSPVTIKAITVRNSNASSVTTQQVKLTLPEPVIIVDGTVGTATITCSNNSATIYYTTDGSTPSPTNGTQYNGGTISGLATMATVKAIAICDGWNSSSVASATVTIPSGVSGGTVTLFDYEDHKWSYYSDEECPIHSLNPADVKITYYGNGTKTVTNASAAEAVENPTSFSLDATTVKVGPNDDANVFVYYKTLERENVDGTGNVPYTTIPNPFLVRPTGNSSTVTITPTYGTVYLSWSCGEWSYWGTQAEVTYTYTEPDGNQQSGSGTSNGDATIQVKAGTTITLTAKGARSNRSDYQPTITARLNNNTGEQIGSVTSTTTTAISSETNAVTVSPQTITTSTYRGFYAWRVKRKSSGLDITDVNGNSFANNIIPAEAEIRFVTSNEYGNEVEFEALWAQAYVTSGTGNLTSYSNSYERNFHVVTSSTSASSFQKSYPLTVTSRYPDGTSAGGSVTGEFTAAADTKFENITISNATNATWTANGHDLIVGRGCSGTVNYVRGISEDITNPNYTIRLESGTYKYLSHLRGYYTSSSGNTGGGSTVTGSLHIKSILGCDYDRASNVNDNLKITQNAIMAVSTTVNSEEETLNITVKSGNIGSDVPETSTNIADAYQSIYLSVASSQRKVGKRSLTVEGGILSNIAGGIDKENNSDHGETNFESLYIRMKGGLVRGAIYGGAAKSPAGGNRRMIFTGGTVYGWVGAGCNGTEDSGGQTYGGSKMYIGGDCHIGQSGTEWSINGVNGGYVFGAGKGYAGGSGTSGEMSHGTKLVVADEAYIKHDVYGGGNYGYTTDSYLYILGGTIGGGAYGGSNQKGGDNTFVTMKDGIVHGGVYGGSNDRGTISNNVTMQINGGQVGTSSAPANIHGGGYGEDTEVSGNVDITLGTLGQTTSGATVYGDVYGGSALGTVNSDANDHTYVTMYKGTINGSLYGGGLGRVSVAANVNGPVKVEVHGGSVKKTSVEGSGGVYGANNIYGAPQSSVTVDIYGTDPAPAEGEYALYAVYGGGNQADYLYGNGYPTVTVHGCDNSIEYVYGGGNAAAVKTTNVTIWGGNVIGNVFGGGNGAVSAANVNGNATTKIYGGTILNVYGGSNSQGTISGAINVTVNSQAENSGDSPCTMNIGDVYGGGNRAASNVGNLNIVCTGTDGYINRVFGGANAAEITGNVELEINGGNIGSVFGGNNSEKSISGNVEVNIGKAPNSCGVFEIGNVHGGGYGEATGVKGNVEVNIAGGTINGDVYGGSALGKVNTNTNNTTKVNLTGGIIHGDAYGGGLGASGIAADVNGNVTVTLNGTAFVLATTTDDKGNTIPTSGRVFGCNNINGSPQGTVLVKVLSTVARDGAGNVKDKPTINSNVYELQAVYGGGNLAAYNPTNPKATGQYTYTFNSDTYGAVNFTAVEKPVQVVIDGCGLTSIEYVYGGGNAAPTPATDVIVLGSYEIGNVFGGGNGKDRYILDGGWEENPGADVGIIDAVAYQQNTANGKYGTGMSKASVLGGTVHNLFGASNTKGNVVTESLAYVDNANICDLNVGGIYGGGNEAYMDGDSKIELGCIEALEEIYGGARNADVKGDIKLTISSGHFDRVFGGNNIGGKINGSITVTIDETGCNPVTIGELYGCGNQAPYTTPEGEEDPIINLISFTSIGNVFGGGLGADAVVTGNPTVNINVEKLGKNADRENWSYNGSTINFGNDYIVQLPVHEKGKIGVIGTVYGGGNAAAVIGNTTVKMTKGIVENTLFGGGNAANVEGSTSVTILDGTIGGNVYGGGNKGDVTGATKVQIGEQPTP